MRKTCGPFVFAASWSAAVQGAPFDQAYWIAVLTGVVQIEASRPGGGCAFGTGVAAARGAGADV